VVNVGLHERGQDSPISFVKLRMTCHGCLAVTQREC
jgi:hypothetical protein